MELLWFILFGALIGWLAGKFTRGAGFGLIGNIAVGIVGSIIGKYGFSLLGLQTNTLAGEILFSVLGAIVLVFIIGKVKR